MRGLGHFNGSELTRTLPQWVLGEVFSLPLAVLLPVAYYDLPPLAFLILVFGAVAIAILFRLSEQSRRALERRINELATLNKIGQSIASSLAMNDLMQGIYNQVSALMDVTGFYIALYSGETQGLTFPFALMHGQPVKLEDVAHSTGINNYIIYTRQPLLLQGHVNSQLPKLGITQPIANECVCFLGVPL